MTDDALIPVQDFLKGARRSYRWWADHRHDPECVPPLPREIRQGRNLFVLSSDAARYHRDLLRLSGIRGPGRPRKIETAEKPNT
jgi:hypothetical protein